MKKNINNFVVVGSNVLFIMIVSISTFAHGADNDQINPYFSEMRKKLSEALNYQHRLENNIATAIGEELPYPDDEFNTFSDGSDSDSSSDDSEFDKFNAECEAEEAEEEELERVRKEIAKLMEDQWNPDEALEQSREITI